MKAVAPFETSAKESRASGAAGPRPILVEMPDPLPGPGEVGLRVHASALNRADLLQLRGWYPPPPGESEIPGLECSGVIERVGPDVEGWAVGDRVMALLAGGGHAEKVIVPSGQLMPVPPGLSFAEAAALPEAALTSWTNLVVEGGLEPGQTVLVVAAASGIGTFACQLARALGARVLVAGRCLGRLSRLRPLGAEQSLILDETLPARVREVCGNDGVDLVMDLAGGDAVGERLTAVRAGGRYVLVGVLAGAAASIDLGDLLKRRVRLQGSVLRSRSRTEKAALVEAFSTFAADRWQRGELRPVVDRVWPLERVAEAYDTMAGGGLFGKLVLVTDSCPD